MNYKLLVLDVDGTLLNEANLIGRRTKAAVMKIQQLGVRVVLASGRPTDGLVALGSELNLDTNGGFVLSYNGGQILNLQTQELLFEKRIDPQIIPYLDRKAKKNNLAIFTYHQGCILTDSPHNRWIGKEARLNRLEIIGVSDFAEAIDFAPHKCMIVSDNGEALADLESAWKKRLNGVVDVFRSEDYFLEIVPPYVDKANTLSFLLEKLSVEAKEVVAVGDGVCDVTMLQLAGLGVAMGNAPDSVKACADCLTGSNEEDGVAMAVEKYMLAPQCPTELSPELLSLNASHSLTDSLGIQFTYASGERVEAIMPVDYRTCQPFGILHGGATLALAESVAGLGSLILCAADETMVGMQVSGNHLSSAHMGDMVRAVASIIHRGRSSHVWNVDVFTSTDKLISSVRVLNCIRAKSIKN